MALDKSKDEQHNLDKTKDEQRNLDKTKDKNDQRLDKTKDKNDKMFKTGDGGTKDVKTGGK